MSRWRTWGEIPTFMKNDFTLKYYRHLSRKRTSMVFKRIFDVIMSAVLLVLLSPVILVLAVWIKVDSRVFALYSFYESNGRCTQKMISEKWNIPKQTVNTILKDFQKKGYINMVSDDSDKRNKLICLTESGMEYTKDIIEKLHSKEIYVIEKMGLENIESLNDNTELFIRLFKEGDCKKNES